MLLNNNIQITAHLATAFDATDQWLPSIDNLLIWLLLNKSGRLTLRPSAQIADSNKAFIVENLPVSIGTLYYSDWFEGLVKEEWYHQVSSPFYFSFAKTSNKTTRRWDKQDQHLDWQGKPAKWNSQGFHTRSMLHCSKLELTPRIDWFIVGDYSGIEDLLTNCQTLGKSGRGQVLRWEIKEIESDMHLFGIDGRLMRPIPKQFLPITYNYPQRLIQWGWRSPINLPENIAVCAMPNNVRRV
jgi:hypothetical protein